MSAPRTLESFSKQDLVEFIKNSSFFWGRNGEQMIHKLAGIERVRKFKELDAKLAALQAEMANCDLPQDWKKYKDLSEKWNAACRAWDRTYKGRI
ncbi:hypothetical protein DSECCO2_470140 [anaerobic digester metagenome]